MAEGEGGAQGAGAAELTNDAGGAGGDGGTGGGNAPEWLASLPDELKSDATLGKYADVEALARGHLETKRLASSKLAIPGEGAKAEDWDMIYAALGRPETPDGYELPIPAPADDADDAAKAAHAEKVKAYGELFHKAGLNGNQAKTLVEADLARIEAASEAYYAKGQQEIDALKAEMGADYEPQKEAAKAMFVKLFGDDAVQLADELDQKVGSGALMKGMMKLAKLTGEHGRVDGGGGDLKGTKDPDAQIDALFADKAWRQRYNDGDQEAVGQYNRLLEAAKAQAVAATKA